MLPTGLTLNSATGEISGTVDAGLSPGAYPVTIRMCDENSDGICCQKQFSITVTEPFDWSVFDGKDCSDVDWDRTMTATVSEVTVNGVGSTSGTIGGCFPTVENPTDGVAVNVHVDLTITQAGDNPQFFMFIGSSFGAGDYFTADTSGMGDGTFHFSADFTGPQAVRWFRFGTKPRTTAVERRFPTP